MKNNKDTNQLKTSIENLLIDLAIGKRTPGVTTAMIMNRVNHVRNNDMAYVIGKRLDQNTNSAAQTAMRVMQRDQMERRDERLA